MVIGEGSEGKVTQWQGIMFVLLEGEGMSDLPKPGDIIKVPEHTLLYRGPLVEVNLDAFAAVVMNVEDGKRALFVKNGLWYQAAVEDVEVVKC